MQKIIRIPSKLYRNLYEKGGDRLVSVFCMLKAARNSKNKFTAYVSTNNKTLGGYGLLRKHSGISLNTLEKYVPTLVKMDLIHFESNGDVYIIGNEKAKELYSSYKLVPVAIEKKLTDTASRSMFVRTHSNISAQKKEIAKKQFRSDLLKHLDNPDDLKLYNMAKRVAKKAGGNIVITPDTRLSNTAFSRLKHNERKLASPKGTGYYWKKKLEQKGFIECERSFTIIAPMGYGAFLSLKKAGSLNRNELYNSGALCKEGMCKVSIASV